MIFPSKKDRWLTLLLLAASLVATVVGVIVLIAGPSRWAGLLLILAAVFIWWLMQYTYYVIGETDLVIRSGPFRWSLPLDEIEDITPTRNPLSSPALSLDRLWISYGRSDKTKSIMISPDDKEGFLIAMTARVPGLKTEGKGVRVSIAEHTQTDERV